MYFQDLGKNLKLKIDVKTRWNSMMFMLQRFLQVKGPVHKVLIDLQKEALFPTDLELKTISDMVEALVIVEASSRKLCQRDISLADADQVIIS